jgi:hypothetical protein
MLNCHNKLKKMETFCRWDAPLCEHIIYDVSADYLRGVRIVVWNEKKCFVIFARFNKFGFFMQIHGHFMSEAPLKALHADLNTPLRLVTVQ